MEHNCKVLVVDDSEDIARLIKQYSAGEPIDVLVVVTAEEGLEKLKETQFDLVLMDFHLPGMDGAAAVRSARLLEKQLKRRPSPIFALTDLLDLDSGEQMLRAGCTALVGKPLSRQQFLTIASRWRQHTLKSPPEKEIPVKPLRILIAEDSADNRLLLEVFLRQTTHCLTFVDNGQLAVDRFAVESFDLILMDMNMPIMDGLTATRAIRAVEQERGAVPIPIIALTGNKGPQEVALSSAAGCDRHLPKPISKRHLLNIIAEYGPLMSPVVASAQTIQDSPPPGLSQIVHGYLAARRKELPEMRALLAASHFDEIVVLAHNIKGTGRSYGFAALTQMGDALERSAKQADGAALDKQLAKISEYLDRVQLSATPFSM